MISSIKHLPTQKLKTKDILQKQKIWQQNLFNSPNDQINQTINNPENSQKMDFFKQEVNPDLKNKPVKKSAFGTKLLILHNQDKKNKFIRKINTNLRKSYENKQEYINKRGKLLEIEQKKLKQKEEKLIRTKPGIFTRLLSIIGFKLNSFVIYHRDKSDLEAMKSLFIINSTNHEKKFKSIEKNTEHIKKLKEIFISHIQILPDDRFNKKNEISINNIDNLLNYFLDNLFFFENGIEEENINNILSVQQNPLSDHDLIDQFKLLQLQQKFKPSYTVSIKSL